ncbi:hypothetical protein VR41_03940 [Streptomyces sp. NRRL B-1568]|nr:hypothetical protein VR41_03940 [Streptomyces sp. NRRL B-1568]
MRATGSAAGHAAAPPAGLRERKKRRTRDTLARSALELFDRQGYEGTTIDEIAALADVSQRTFFRYFASKEEAALSVQSMVESHFLAAVRARPAPESPLTALRAAVLASWDTIEEAIQSVVPLELHIRTYRMIEANPQLLAEHLRRQVELEEELTREIARREGLDSADPRPRILVSAFGGVMRVTGRLLSSATKGDVNELKRTIAEYLDQIGPALAENWRT